jgi:Lipase (class 3)
LLPLFFVPCVCHIDPNTWIPIERAKASKLKRPLTVEEYDDRHQTNELVYGITKDDIHKRITLVFRGTDNALAFSTNWITNLYTSKCQGIVPVVVQAALPSGGGGASSSSRIWFHSGYFNYVFSLTLDEKDHVGWRKYDEILKDVQRVLRDHPGYKLYVTGHSLGAALATLVSFYLTCEPDIPKPVTCINFASPRIGDGHFLKAVRALEERGWLRMLRIVYVL